MYQRIVAVLTLLWACGGCGDSNGGSCAPAPKSCDDHDPCTVDSMGQDASGCAACIHTAIPAGAADRCCPPGATQRQDPDCAPRCGDGVLDPGEQCDDGNTGSVDGCSSTCKIEEALILSSWTFEDGMTGCDLDGDGRPDNAFGGAANNAARQLMSSFANAELHRDGSYLVNLFVLTNLSDLSGGNDAGFQIGLVFGKDRDMMTGNNFDASQPFPVDPRTYAMDVPIGGWFTGTTANGALEAKTARVIMPLTIAAHDPMVGTMVQFAPYWLTNITLMPVQTPSGPRVGGFMTGRLCGAVAAGSLAQFVNASGAGGPTYLDVLVLGVNFQIYQIMPTQPDVDVDGDGIETFMDTDNDKHIDLCIDGNGTQIGPGNPACALDPRIADAYSVSVAISASQAVLAGIAP